MPTGWVHSRAAYPYVHANKKEIENLMDFPTKCVADAAPTVVSSAGVLRLQSKCSCDRQS